MTFFVTYTENVTSDNHTSLTILENDIHLREISILVL